MTHTLSEFEKQEYRGFLKSAFTSVRNVSADLETRNTALDNLVQVETYVAERNKGRASNTLERNFALQIGLADAHFNTVSGMFRRLHDRVYGRLPERTELDEILNDLALDGAYVDLSERVYVLTDESIGGEPGGDGELSVTEYQHQPRLKILVSHLRDPGALDMNDLVVRVGRRFETAMRKMPYVIVEIPRLGKQVAVCDQYGEITFVSQKILHPNVWASFRKSELKAMEGINAVPYGGKWSIHIMNLLYHGEMAITPSRIKAQREHQREGAEEQGVRPTRISAEPEVPIFPEKFILPPKIDVSQDVKRRAGAVRPDLSHEMILNHLLLYLKKYKRWPSTSNKQQSVETLPDEKWSNWNIDLRHGHRNLPGGSSLNALIDSFICEQALLYKKKHGVLPSRASGSLENYPDITWEAFEDASIQSGNQKRNLMRIFAEGDIVGQDSGLTEASMLEHILKYFKTHEHTWPIQKSGDVEGFPGETWRLWDGRLRKGSRGLPGGSSLMDLIDRFIAEQARIYRKHHGGDLPTRDSGPLRDYPDISWGDIDSSLIKRVAHHRTNLARLIKEHRVSEDVVDLTEDYILQHMIEYFINHGHVWPSSTRGGDVDGLSGENWRNWEYALRNGYRGLLGNSSLEILGKNFIVAQAQLYQKEHDRNLPTYESGPLQSHPDITWRNIEDAYLIRSGELKQNLDQIWIEAGLITEKDLLGQGVDQIRVVKRTFSEATLARLRETKRIITDKPLTPEIVLGHILLHLKKHKKWPSASTASDLPDVETFPEEKWAAWDGYLKDNLRGLKTNLSLMKFIDSFVCRQAELHREKCGTLPTKDSGPLIGHPDVEWSLIQAAYSQKGSHKKDLSRVFVEGHLIDGCADLTEDFIFRQATKYLHTHDLNWPNQLSGAVEGLKNEKWQHWDTSLKRGDRGLAGGSNLPDMILRYIVREAQLYQEEHNGVLPTRSSGALKNYPDITWEQIEDGYLNKGGKYKKNLEDIFTQAGLKVQYPENAHEPGTP